MKILKKNSAVTTVQTDSSTTVLTYSRTTVLTDSSTTVPTGYNTTLGFLSEFSVNCYFISRSIDTERRDDIG